MYTFFNSKIEDIDEQFISKNRINARIGLDRKVKDLYDIRSSFAYGSISNYEMSSEIEQEYKLLTSLLWWITEKILELRKSGIVRIDKTSTDDETSLDYHVQTLKYAYA